jgi:hypothetical protein
MVAGLIVGSIVLQAVVFVVLWGQLRRAAAEPGRLASAEAARLAEAWDRLDRNTREEIARNRTELSEALSRSTTAMSTSLAALSQSQKSELDGSVGITMPVRIRVGAKACG